MTERWSWMVMAPLGQASARQFEGTPGQMAAALKEMGFYDVAEVALGADLTKPRRSGGRCSRGRWGPR